MQHSKARVRDGHTSTEEFQTRRSDSQAWQGSLPRTEEVKIKVGFNLPCLIATLSLLDADISVSCTSSFSCPGSLENTMPSPRRHTRWLSSQDELLCLRLLCIPVTGWYLPSYPFVNSVTLTGGFPALLFGALTPLRCQLAIWSVLTFPAVLICGALMFCYCWPGS